MPQWSREFDDCGKRVLHDGDVDALLDFAHKAPAARTAHLAPSTSRRCSSRWARANPIFGCSARRSRDSGVGLAKRSIQLG